MQCSKIFSQLHMMKRHSELHYHTGSPSECAVFTPPTHDRYEMRIPFVEQKDADETFWHVIDDIQQEVEVDPDVIMASVAIN